MSEEYQQGYEQGINDLADRLKTYYNNLNGTTSCGLVITSTRSERKCLKKPKIVINLYAV